MVDRTQLIFQDHAGNIYNEAQVVLDERDGKKVFHSGIGGVVVQPTGSGAPSEEIWDAIDADRKAAKSGKTATTNTQLPGDK